MAEEKLNVWMSPNQKKKISHFLMFPVLFRETLHFGTARKVRAAWMNRPSNKRTLSKMFIIYPWIIYWIKQKTILGKFLKSTLFHWSGTGTYGTVMVIGRHVVDFPIVTTVGPFVSSRWHVPGLDTSRARHLHNPPDGFLIAATLGLVFLSQWRLDNSLTYGAGGDFSIHHRGLRYGRGAPFLSCRRDI